SGMGSRPAASATPHHAEAGRGRARPGEREGRTRTRSGEGLEHQLAGAEGLGEADDHAGEVGAEANAIVGAEDAAGAVADGLLADGGHASLLAALDHADLRGLVLDLPGELAGRRV